MTIGDEDDEPAEFDLANFLENHSELFVVLGVFAASAIYLVRTSGNSIQEASLVTQLGFGGAVVIVLLVVGLIYQKMATEVGGWGELSRYHTRIRSFPLLIFTTGMTLIFAVFFFRLLSRANVTYILIHIITVSVSIGVVLRLFSFLSTLLPDEVSYPQLVGLTIAVGLAAILTREVFFFLDDNLLLISMKDYDPLTRPFRIYSNVILIFAGIVQSAIAFVVFLLAIGSVTFALDIFLKRVYAILKGYVR